MSVFDSIQFVLVEPQQPGNIGAAARALRTMGMSRMTMVNPLREPDLLASWRAAGGADLLAAARTVPDLDEAIGGSVLVAATSARDRRIPWPLKDLRRAATDLVEAAARGPVSILFGRETSGLTNDELHRAHLHIQIPSAEDYGVLNVAMAVQVVAYEVRMAALGDRAIIDTEWDQAPATAADTERLLEHLGQVLESIGYIDPSNPRQVLTRLRRLVLRAHLDEVEVRILRGVLRMMEGQAERVDRDPG